jgi:hypothetical protein
MGIKLEKHKIGGPGIIIEVDESKFGRRKYNRGHRVEGVWVMGGVEWRELRNEMCSLLRSQIEEQKRC